MLQLVSNASLEVTLISAAHASLGQNPATAFFNGDYAQAKLNSGGRWTFEQPAIAGGKWVITSSNGDSLGYMVNPKSRGNLGVFNKKEVVLYEIRNSTSDWPGYFQIFYNDTVAVTVAETTTKRNKQDAYDIILASVSQDPDTVQRQSWGLTL